MLTSEQRRALCVLVLLFLLGLAVKTWRAAHPASHVVSSPAQAHATR